MAEIECETEMLDEAGGGTPPRNGADSEASPNGPADLSGEISAEVQETVQEFMAVAAQQNVAVQMVQLEKPTFDAHAFLTSAGLGRRIVHLAPKQNFFTQGDPADAVFYLQKGRAKITVVSTIGKEATITFLSDGDFVGEGSLSAVPGLRLATATAITACTALKIGREEMIRVMHEEHDFSDVFMKFLLKRSMRIQADLVDQLFNSSEKRLARILLLMSEFGRPDEPESLVPKISQETLAEMIGTTRSRVSFFMNRFRKLGFIDYNGRIRVHKSLLNVIPHDHLPDDNAENPPIQDIPA
jgi:CRP-like cAMP-binding protein